MRWMWQALTFAVLLAIAAPMQASAQDAETDALAKRVEQLFHVERYPEAFSVSKERAEAAEKAETAKGAPSSATANALGELAWYALFARQPDQALAASERALMLTPNTLWLQKNRAHALLFLGKADAAIKAYIAHKGEIIPNQGKWEEAILNDFAEFQSRRLYHSDMDRVERVVAEAVIETAKGALALAEQKFGPDHPSICAPLRELARQYANHSLYADAEALYKRALVISEKAFGPDHQDVQESLFALAVTYHNQSRYAEADPLFKRLLETYERVHGKDDPQTLQLVAYLAYLYLKANRFDEAAPLYERVLEVKERALGKEHPDPDTLDKLNSLATIYVQQGRYREAERLFKLVLEQEGGVLDKLYRVKLAALDNLATIYLNQGRYDEAEPLFKRDIETSERVLGKEHPDTLLGISNLVGLYLRQKRFDEAETLLHGLIEANERVFGMDGERTLISVGNLAFVYKERNRPAEAETLYKRSNESSERVFGKDNPDLLRGLVNLADIYSRQRRFGEAEQLYKRVLEAEERLYGRENPDALIVVSNLALNYFAQSDWLSAAQYWRREAAAIAKEDQREAQDIGQGPAGMKKSAAQRESYVFRNLIKAVTRLTPEGQSPDPAASRETFEIAQWASGSEAAASLSQMAARGAKGNRALAVLVRERQDLVAEWQKRDASRIADLAQPPEKRDRKAEAENLARLAAIDARIVGLDKRLAAEYQDYTSLASPAPLSVDQVQANLRPNEALVLFFDTPESNPTPEETFIWVVTKTGVRWARTDIGSSSLSWMVPELRCGLDAEAWHGSSADICTNMRNLPLDNAPVDRKLLPFDLARAHELYNELFGQVEDLIKGKRLLIVPSGPLTQLPFQVLVQSLPQGVPAGVQSREVARLGADLKDLSEEDRKGLQWTGEGGVRIVKVLQGTAAEAAGLKAEDVLLSVGDEKVATYQQTVNAIRAYKPGSAVRFSLWREGQKRDFTIVLGAMTLREWRPLYWDATNARAIRWLARDHAITVLPAVSSLKALRRVGKRSAAKKPMIGFGNPLLDGDQADPKYGAYFKQRAALARENQSCPQTLARTPLQRPASLFGLRRGVAPMAVRGLADVEILKAQLPLPETRDELCAVARDLNADPSEMRLGERATEREVKALSASGALAQYRIVHFATHGVLAGQLDAKAEPGLILTPPETASEEDDGYLTASEIAALKLDADWVILSACNTAAGGATGAEALSGLARAFFYAQARALLVSHWEVDSAATVKLITGAVSEIARDKRVGRAEALRRAMLAMIDGGKPEEAHPAYWAPFVLVGEGAAAR